MRERDDDGAGEKEEAKSDGFPGKVDNALFCEGLAGSRQVFCVCEREMQRGIYCYWKGQWLKDENNASEEEVKRAVCCCGLCLCSMH